MEFPAPLQRLVDELKRLPGIGPKSAQRIAFHLLKGSKDDATRLANAVGTLLDSLRSCRICNAITDQEVCGWCSDVNRSDRFICVVEEAHNIMSVERTHEFKGRYHVLQGVLSPLSGVGPDDLKIGGLIERVRAGGVEEVLLATSPTVEGEATAAYLARLLRPLGPKLTRIAMGVPVGSDLDWADEVTMARSISGRRDF